MQKLFIFFLVFITTANAQLPDTDIYLTDITQTDSGYVFGAPKNITEREGYDNQPYFTPDGRRILYVSIEDSTQSDIYAYDIAAGVRIQITNTPVSEYSPAYSPDKKFLSVVRVDADSGQRFYYMPLSNLNNSAIINNSDNIGYGCLLNDSTLAMFILGKAQTLQLLNMKNGERKLIASDIGRCMKLTPDGTQMYFVIKSNPAEWYIYALNIKTHALSRVIQTMPACEDFAILPNGKLLMGKEGKLYMSENRTPWKQVADFTSTLPDFYRIAISPDGSRMALVVFTGKKP